jgi:hypothetical protein
MNGIKMIEILSGNFSCIMQSKFSRVSLKKVNKMQQTLVVWYIGSKSGNCREYLKVYNAAQVFKTFKF